MKKILFLIALVIGFASITNAQRATTIPLTSGDTIVNTGTASKVILATAGYSGAIVQVNLTKISGTGAGTVQMQGSLDGVTYTNVGSAYTITNTASQSAYFNISGPLPVYLKVLSTGSGTESVSQTVMYVLRKYDRN
jgi:hypothetical protein